MSFKTVSKIVLGFRSNFWLDFYCRLSGGVRSEMSDYSSAYRRLTQIYGVDVRLDDLLYRPPSLQKSEELPSNNLVVYFGGDLQDFDENMRKHRDNGRYADEWSLERTMEILSKKFADSPLLIVRPTEMRLGTFAKFSNFLNCNDMGAPIACPPTDRFAWNHLRSLIDNAGRHIESPISFADCRLILIGFSKGCAVLNQLVYELTVGQPPTDMVDRVIDWYWLDGGHAGSQKTWVIDQPFLSNFADRTLQSGARVHVHVTPRQIRDPNRPWVGREELKFSNYLISKLDSRIERKVHFDDGEPLSMEMHFRILRVFAPDFC